MHGTFAVRRAPRRACAARIGLDARFPTPVAGGGMAHALRLAAGGGWPQCIGDVLRQPHDFEGPGTLLHAAQIATLLQRHDEPVDARLGFKIQRVLHFIERGRHATFAHPFVDEHQ